ncbi:hypothetical protein [Oricola sp.]|uniref:hypothetical protein n=1 Tax=Oricola sp. TaxID=1979950 RepID=UPI0025FA1893|nr:hypothetical protein [Oricola sp.]MCI5078713.1 hypothetical protein [Oricola sp.]
MSQRSELEERLRKVEALFERAGSAGEAAAAAAAVDRLQAKLGKLPPRREDPEIELQYSLPDLWAVRLFYAVCRKHGVTPYRYSRQRRTTVVVKVRRSHFMKVVDGEFQLLHREMMDYFNETAEHLIRNVMKSDGNDYDDHVPQLTD